MSTLKERLIGRIEVGMENCRRELDSFQKLKDRIEQFDGLEIEVGEKDADVYVSSYGSSTINCSKPGLGQEVANCIATDLGIEFSKEFDQEHGQHTYTANLSDPHLSFYICAEPPENCKIEWTQTEERRTVRRAKANCE